MIKHPHQATSMQRQFYSYVYARPANMMSTTVLQSKRANFVVFKVFCYIHKSIQEGSILSLWKGQQALVQLCGKLHVVM